MRRSPLRAAPAPRPSSPCRLTPQPSLCRRRYEEASERWLPIHTVQSILLSVISMISSPNDESPANVDAAKMFRDDYPAFKKKVQRCVRKSQDE